ncbi:hypothetical protein FQN60_007501, partial [Etheostoma spectabile]
MTFSDVGIIIEGVVVLQDLDSMAHQQPCCLDFVIFEHEVSVTAPLHFEGIQKVLMELD